MTFSTTGTSNQSTSIRPQEGGVSPLPRPPSQKALWDSGLDVPNVAYDEVVMRMKLIFGRPRLNVSEAQARLRSLTLSSQDNPPTTSRPK